MSFMMKRLVFLSVIFTTAQFVISHSGYSQVNISVLSSNDSADFYYRFPIIKHPSEEISCRINKSLQNELLSNEEPITDEKALFNNSREELDSTWTVGLTHIDFSVLMNNSKLFSISFELEFISASVHTFPVYFNFHMTNGNEVKLQDLVSINARANLASFLIEQRKDRIVDWKKQLSGEYQPGDSLWVGEVFAECNRSADIENFFIGKKELVFYKVQCFPKIGQPYETDLDVKISFKELDRYLHSEGRRLLGLKD